MVVARVVCDILPIPLYMYTILQKHYGISLLNEQGYNAEVLGVNLLLELVYIRELN